MLKNIGLLLLLAAWSVPSFAATEDPLKPGLHDSSEAGVVIATGNSESQSYNLKQSNSYGWGDNGLRFGGTYLDTSTGGNVTARYWSLGLRYERSLVDHFSVYAGELVESDVFSGYFQRYSTDVGGKYFIFHETDFTWTGEAGFRHTIENQAAGQDIYDLLRFYTEVVRNFTKDTSGKLWLEYMPNLTHSDDYQFNGEASVSAAFSEVFSLKTGYLVKYRNTPPTPGLKRTDTWFTTALVAKF
jgi:putative salt-induced outer membrane protein